MRFRKDDGSGLTNGKKDEIMTVRASTSAIFSTSTHTKHHLQGNNRPALTGKPAPNAVFKRVRLRFFRQAANHFRGRRCRCRAVCSAKHSLPHYCRLFGAFWVSPRSPSISDCRRRDHYMHVVPTLKSALNQWVESKAKSIGPIGDQYSEQEHRRDI